MMFNGVFFHLGQYYGPNVYPKSTCGDEIILFCIELGQIHSNPPLLVSTKLHCSLVK